MVYLGGTPQAIGVYQLGMFVPTKVSYTVIAFPRLLPAYLLLRKEFLHKLVQYLVIQS